MATIKDVAKRANVSTTTVSHVINKTRFVAEETRNAVWAAIKELHYSPSAVARSLKVNHTKSIGLLATSSEAAYFAEIIEAVEKNCFQKGYPDSGQRVEQHRKTARLPVDDGAKARRWPAGHVFRVPGIRAVDAGRVSPYPHGGHGLG